MAQARWHAVVIWLATAAGSKPGCISRRGARTFDVTAANGAAGEWLLDPVDITISTASTNNISESSNGTGTLFLSDAAPSSVNVGEVQSALDGGASVLIQTGSAGTDGGNITWQSGASLDYSTSSGSPSLGLEATGYIELNSDINVGPGGLSLSAATGYVASSSAITLNLGGPLTITAGDATQTNKFFAATLTGSGNLNKAGAGRLIVSGIAFLSGNTTIQSGTARHRI